MCALVSALRQPRINGAIVTPSFRIFRQVVLPLWRRIVPAPLYTWRAADGEIVLRNGSVIYCVGVDRAEERIIGLNLGWAVGDEVGAMRDGRVAGLLMQRIREGAEDQRHLSLFTSPHGFSWLSDWAVQRASSGEAIVDVVNASTYSNPFLSRGYVRDLEIDFPPGSLLHRQELLGEFVARTGLVYGDVFGERSTRLVDLEYDPALPYALGWDPGSRASGVVAVQRGMGGRHIVVREWTPDGQYTEDTAAAVLRDMRRAPAIVYMDTPSKLNTRTGITDVRALRAAFPGAKVRVLGGHARSSEWRHRALVGALRRGHLLFSRSLTPRVDRGSRGIVRALETLSWADESTRIERADSKDPVKHVVDALEFYCAIELPPRYGGIQPGGEA